jgi:hypothetical protein
VIKNRVKVGGMHRPPLPGWADFTIMMECQPESVHCHSVCILCGIFTLKTRACNRGRLGGGWLVRKGPLGEYLRQCRDGKWDKTSLQLLFVKLAVYRFDIVKV